MKVIIAGSREFSNFQLMFAKCEEILGDAEQVEIVSGTARGADKMGEHYASLKGFKVKQFPADWNKFGKAAGHIRNKEMAGYADMLIAFWDGISSGTSSMINLAKENGLDVHVIRY
jgi:predicted Rossmann fold nucleotide-binding protein DprA/Smf involved in DNA uptake